MVVEFRFELCPMHTMFLIYSMPRGLFSGVDSNNLTISWGKHDPRRGRLGAHTRGLLAAAGARLLDSTSNNNGGYPDCDGECHRRQEDHPITTHASNRGGS